MANIYIMAKGSSQPAKPDRLPEVIRLSLALNSRPSIHEHAFVHKDAVVAGRVHLSRNSSVWQGAILRADKGVIRIGEGSNIQDCCVMHAPNKKSETIIGNYTSVGKGVILNSCKIGDHCIIGKGAVILEDAIIGDYSIIGEGAFVTRYFFIPARSLVFGNPAKVQGQVDNHGLENIRKTAQQYVKLARDYG